MNIKQDQIMMVLDCENRESRLSEWENSFIDSIGNQLGNDRQLSRKQDALLEKIWDKVTGNG